MVAELSRGLLPPDAEPRRGSCRNLGHARHAVQRRRRRRRATVRVQWCQQVRKGVGVGGRARGTVYYANVAPETLLDINTY